VHQAAGTQYFLVQRGQIVPVTQFEALLLIGNPKLASVYPQDIAPVVVPESAIADATRQLLPASLGWPDATVDPVTATAGSVCVMAGPDGVPRSGTQESVTAEAGAGTTGQTVSGGILARVPPGSGVLVEETNAAGGSTAAVWFVDGTGRRFCVPGTQALGALGLQAAVRVKVPAGVLAALRLGPTLDIAAAGRSVEGAVSTLPARPTVPAAPTSGT
jgi:hypothetical protein